MTQDGYVSKKEMHSKIEVVNDHLLFLGKILLNKNKFKYVLLLVLFATFTAQKLKSFQTKCSD